MLIVDVRYRGLQYHLWSPCQGHGVRRQKLFAREAVQSILITLSCIASASIGLEYRSRSTSRMKTRFYSPIRVRIRVRFRIRVGLGFIGLGLGIADEDLIL